MKLRFLQNMSKRQRTIICISTGIVLALFVTLYLLLPVIAKQAIRSKIAKVEQERQVNIDMDQLRIAHFSIFGTFDIRIKQLQVQDKKATEPFVQIDQMRTKVQAWKGFRRTLILKNFEANTIQLCAIKRDGYCNYNFTKGRKNGKKVERNYQRLVTTLIHKANDYCPKQLSINTLDAHTDIDSLQVRYLFNELAIHNGKANGTVSIQQQGEKPENWTLSGLLNNKKQQYEGTIVRQGGDTTLGSLPFLRSFEKLDVQLHEAHGKFSLLKSDKKHTTCTLSGNLKKLQCQHHYLADVPVRIDAVGGELQLNINAKSIIIDSTSTISLNDAKLHPYLCFSNDKSKHIIFKINEKDRDAEPLFASLPSDLFQIIPNLKVTGKMDFNCLLDCDFGQLDSLKFDFNLINRQRSLRIVEGLGEITRFNDQFEYTFYDHGEPIRTLWIGPNNPYFCASYEIPELLKQAILASEDGAFFVHNGFCKSAMQQAIIDDIKAGKMRRGGSTITMQLIKNLFLSRKKVLTRKFEEMLLVWMIEDQHLISKDRMFEIYVNIIEWAPGVIGIGEASEFYFHKRPSQLTMPECIYLASLIRAPKHYASTLNPDGTITDTKRAELEFVADRMVIREFMTERQRANFDSNVKTVIRSGN